MATTELTKDNVEQMISESSMLVIDFWAEWCGPCKSFGPTFEKVSEKFPDATFVKCDTENQGEVAAAFGVRSIPTLAIFRDQVLLFKESGAFPEPMLADIIEKVSELDMAEVHAEVAKQNADGEAEPADKE